VATAPQQPPDPARQGIDYFVSQGWTRAQAVGIVANLQAESGLRANAVGDGGTARGIAQWHPDRQAAFEHLMGHPIQQATYAEQLQFVHHELTAGGERGAGNRLRNTVTANDAGSIVSQFYERPADRAGEANRRGQAAQQLLQTYPAPAAPAAPATP